jgi:hypothetical protein
LAENERDIGSESAIAERIVSHIPESVRSAPGYKFVVAETKSFVPDVVEGTKDPLDMFDKPTKLAGDWATRFTYKQVRARNERLRIDHVVGPAISRGAS